jgi:hypothetical protein
MADLHPETPLPRKPVRVPSASGATGGIAPATESTTEPTPRVAISLGVADGFRFGCGILLAGAVFYCGLVVVVALLFVLASLLGVPLPLGLGGH